MKLAHTMLETPIQWDENNICTLVIENPVLYRNVIIEMLNQASGNTSKFVLSDNIGNVIDLGKNTEIISDIFNINPAENKKLITEIIKEVSGIALHDMMDKVVSLYENVHAVLSEAVYRSGLDVTYDEFGDIAALFKLYNLRPDIEDASFLEKILLYIELCDKYLNKKLFIFLNFRDYITDKEAIKFFKDLIYRNINVLIIERHTHKLLEYETRRIIDEDLCEI